MFETALFYSAERGIEYLAKNQQPNGSFLSFSSPYPDNFKKVILFKSIFSTALILQSLTKIPETKKIKKIKQDAAQFLLSQRSSIWTWNYWDRTSKEAIRLPYPDDLDDTFCTLTALYLYKPKLITGKVLGLATQLLTELEVKEGGPYKTWLVNDAASEVWKDVDLGVNANIAYFLATQDVRLPNLTKLFDDAIEKKEFTTPYYPKPFPVLYFISRFVKGNKRKEKLRKEIVSLHATTALDLALQIASLLYTNSPVKIIKSKIEELLTLQKEDGSWDASAFYTGVNPKKDRKFFAGSQSLTTTICLEAIHLYIQKNHKKTTSQTEINKTQKYMIDIHANVLETVNKRISQLGPNLQVQAHVYLKQIFKNDKEKQITLLPYMFYQTLRVAEKEIPISIMTQLGAASVYGWMAYTIYDNFLDEEAVISSLPLANVCLRELTTIFDTILRYDSGFYDVFKNVMDQQEEVNTWETIHCRFDPAQSIEHIKLPDYKTYEVLADRSMGHALGCIAVMMSLGYKKDSIQVGSLLSFFKNYLIARQLNDDAHDWEKDLKMGQINSVGAMLLTKTRKDLGKVFWYDVVDDVCDQIMLHAKLARESLAKIKVIKNPKALYHLIEKQELSVHLTKQEKKKAHAFLTAFSKT